MTKSNTVIIVIAVEVYVHCKNIRISADVLWRVFHILTEPVPYTFVSVNRRNNEAQGPHNIRGHTDIFYNV